MIVPASTKIWLHVLTLISSVFTKLKVSMILMASLVLQFILNQIEGISTTSGPWRTTKLSTKQLLVLVLLDHNLTKVLMLFSVVWTRIKLSVVLEVSRKFQQWHTDQIGCTPSSNGHLKAGICSTTVKNLTLQKNRNGQQSSILVALTSVYQRQPSKLWEESGKKILEDKAWIASMTITSAK